MAKVLTLLLFGFICSEANFSMPSTKATKRYTFKGCSMQTNVITLKKSQPEAYLRPWINEVDLMALPTLQAGSGDWRLTSRWGSPVETDKRRTESGCAIPQPPP